MKVAPVLLFTYKRVEALKQTIKALQTNFLAKETDLFIFSDGAKGEKDIQKVEEVRLYIKSVTDFKSVTINEATKNKGLAKSIIDGVSNILVRFDNVIVLEDDLITTPNFLNFMNESLVYYENNAKVFSISGYSYPFAIPESYNYDAFAITRGCSWGWATWKNRWQDVDWDLANYQLIKSDKKYYKKFNFSGTDLISMLEKQMRGKIDSWAIRWYFHQFQKGQLTIYPIRSFVSNDGFDQEATHTNVYNRYKTILNDGIEKEFRLPVVDSYNSYFQKCIQKNFSKITRIFMGRGMTMLKRLGLVEG